MPNTRTLRIIAAKDRDSLSNEIAASSDWSTRHDTCIGCIKGDLECSLKPVADFLTASGSKPGKIAAELIRALYADDAIARNLYSAISADFNNRYSHASAGIRKALSPIIKALREHPDDSAAKEALEHLQAISDGHDRTREFTAEEKKQRRARMIAFGEIKWDDMTPQERSAYRAAELEENRRRRERAERDNFARARRGGW